MTGGVDTVLAVTGDPADLSAAKVSTYPLTEATFIELAGDRLAVSPEPSVDDADRWVFPGIQPDVFPLAKALSRIHGNLEWFVTVPENEAGDLHRYRLRGGTGTAVRTTRVSGNPAVTVPEDGVLEFRYTVGEQSNVLEAVCVVVDGEGTDVTDVYLDRKRRNVFSDFDGAEAYACFAWGDGDIESPCRAGSESKSTSHDPYCPLSDPCRGWDDGLHSELWVIGGCRMNRPICESCMDECLCPVIAQVRANERNRIILEGAGSDGWMTCQQFLHAVDDIRDDVAAEVEQGVSQRLDISYLEGREAVQKEATQVLTALLADYDACRFDYNTPRGGLVEALTVLAGINADWDAPSPAPEPETYFHGVCEGDVVEFDWHGTTVRGIVVHPGRNLRNGYLDLDYPDDLNGFASYDTRKIQDFRIVSSEHPSA